MARDVAIGENVGKHVSHFSALFRAGPKRLGRTQRLARLTSMCPERVYFINTDSNYYDTTSAFQTYPARDSWNLDILQSKVNDMDGGFSMQRESAISLISDIIAPT